MGKKIRRVRVGWNFGCAPMRNHASNPCCRRASVELPDFLEFAEFNRLRERMGAEQLGAFEFFDPRLHLTADERMALEAGIETGWAALRCIDRKGVGEGGGGGVGGGEDRE